MSNVAKPTEQTTDKPAQAPDEQPVPARRRRPEHPLGFYRRFTKRPAVRRALDALAKL